MKTTSPKTVKRIRRHARIRAKVRGTEACPRLAVYRSNRSMYAQLINDETGVTLAAADTRAMKAKTPVERAREVGSTVAKAAQAKSIKRVVFDRGGFKYQGAIMALAEGAREGGLEF